MSTPQNPNSAMEPRRGPPRWKFMAVVWLSIYPLITVLSWLLLPHVGSWPLYLRTLALTVIAVPVMVFGLIPIWQRILRSWLRGPSSP